MSALDVFFWFFSGAMLLCGIAVVAARHPIHSALSLTLLFVCMAGLFVLLEAFFLAAVQLLIYAGAVMVLFLFVIMLLDIQRGGRRLFHWFAIGGGVILAGALAWEWVLILEQPLPQPCPTRPALAGRVAEVVQPVFVQYVLPFVVTALVLLVGMVGVVLLSRKEDR